MCQIRVKYMSGVDLVTQCKPARAQIMAATEELKLATTGRQAFNYPIELVGLARSIPHFGYQCIGA